MKPDALAQLAPPAPDFGENILAGIGPDLELPTAVPTFADEWGLGDRASRELPLSTYAPAPVTARPVMDYQERQRLFTRLRAEIVEIKILAGMASRWPRVLVLCVLFVVSSAVAQTVELCTTPRSAPSSTTGLFLNPAEAKKFKLDFEALSFARPADWSLSTPEMRPGRSKPHNDPHEIELIFTGRDGSRWRAVKWEKL